ncbi:glycosyltransferase [Bradyrhizobium sp. LHD-71]|uniref:glycosyltransferase family 32 protein n=1 Tax=Bradyrhizobium sp. LHD-71 TaxID=3072141 RepID=UPI00280EC19D|nr:glycosyltransferase [Bradyrhizobium sp. LHD-71]MDQ8727985.1 glycosyltransferase [Bradyrhizobium sp. LHD-71]
MRVTRFLIGRLIKVTANALKGCCYPIHVVFPNARFTIPSASPALLRRTRHKRIPRVVWQTNFTNRVTLPIYLNYLFNRLMSPTCAYRFMTDEGCLEFIRATYPGPVLDAYVNLRIGAARADFWRVLVLLEHGGVYIDMDANLMWPLEALISDDDRELFILDRAHRVTNFFLASEPKNPLLAKTVDSILANIHSETETDVFNLTGPGAMKAALADAQFNAERQRYVCDQGNFTNEFFQYADHPRGKWTREQRTTSLLIRSKASDAGPSDPARTRRSNTS